MPRVRMMNTPEDYQRIGVSPDHIDLWEDGRRTTPREGVYEWWYFDSILDDGTKVVIHFNTSDVDHLRFAEDHPSATIKITTPDGVDHNSEVAYEPAEASFSTDGCDTRIGPSRFTGDLKTYTIHVEPVEGIGADLTLTSTAAPYRPGTGYIGFGDNDEQFFTWFCVVPRGNVSGTLTIDGQTRQVSGTGYHDHQWSDINPMFAWNNWLWARQNFGDYSILVFDFVAGGAYGFTRFPIAFIHDADGNLVFDNTADVDYQILEEYTDPDSGKVYPKISKYSFDDAGTRVDYTLAETEVLENWNYYGLAPDQAKAMFDKAGLRPTYARYAAKGDLVLTKDGERIERSGNFIYEFVFSGASFKDHVLKG